MKLLNEMDMFRITLSLLALLIISAEIGFRFGHILQSRIEEHSRESVEIIQTSVLALLGLLLAFTFSFAASRYDMRRALIVEESNAIGTAYRRAALFPEPEGAAIQKLLREYVDGRIPKPGIRYDKEQLSAVIQESEKIQDLFWQQAVEIGRKDPHSITGGLLITSLNDVIDIHTKRVIAMGNRIPEAILLLLFVVSIMALGVVGYVCGINGRRNAILTTILAILIAFIVLIIQDLDRSREGLIMVTQKSMIDLQESLARNPSYTLPGIGEGK